MAVTLQSIQEAEKKIRQYVPITPVKFSPFLTRELGVETYLKLENLNLTGSFKIRGATNALLSMDPKLRSSGVVASSAGNHAQGVAFIAQQLNIPATIFMPETAPLVKVAATRSMGAQVVLEGAVYDDCYKAAREYCQANGGTFIHPFADNNVIAGQGSIALELLQQIPNLGSIMTSVGGGGMISGMACALKQTNKTIQVLGAQSAAYPALHQSLRGGSLVKTPPAKTIADGIAVKEPSEITYSLIQKYVDDIWLASEDAITSAIMELAEQDHVLAEGAGATGAGALLQAARAHGRELQPIPGPLAIVICGGNIDMHLLGRLIPRGLRASSRLMRVIVRISDRPGRLADLLNTVSSTEANLIEVEHNRIFGGPGNDEVEVTLDLETIGQDHQTKVREALKKGGFPFMSME